MKKGPLYRFRSLMLPGLKRWIVILMVGIFGIVIGILLLLGYHPIAVSGAFLREMLEHATDVIPHRASGIVLISLSGVTVGIAIIRMIISIVQAYGQTESIPDVLYRRRHLERGPKVVVIGGGTGLPTLLRGMKRYTNNITAIVTVGDDGGSSGRLRAELGVLPPGDIRNCITALADEETLVTELFNYRFESGGGLEGHSFGNLFLTALYTLTKGDFLEAVRVAGRVLNMRGRVLPSTLESIQLVAELEDGRVINGESHITEACGRIKKLRLEPGHLKATPDALEAIKYAELIVIAPGSLYTSIIPNLLVPGVSDAIRKSKAKKIYVCNVLTQVGETLGYTVSDHVAAILDHAREPGTESELEAIGPLLDAVLVNKKAPALTENSLFQEVLLDSDKLKNLSIEPVTGILIGKNSGHYHDSGKLAKNIMIWFGRKKKGIKKPADETLVSSEAKDQEAQSEESKALATRR
ncbi:MAG: gluconeogenesis factor YvcK family protein [Candidatus Melainabacteria bacterium]|nr:gluconeogenesis factor YvcK family protein [Candidatus Melainabacteria bacterium]